MYHTEDVVRTRDKLGEHGVEYMFIGKGAAILQGFSDTTQDIDIYPMNEPDNNRRLLAALGELGFEISEECKADLLCGKDFIQLRNSFELDVVFAPDGFESYDEARRYKRDEGGFPVLSLEGIILTKKSAGRLKDRESLYRLEKFKEYRDGQAGRK